MIQIAAAIATIVNADMLICPALLASQLMAIVTAANAPTITPNVILACLMFSHLTLLVSVTNAKESIKIDAANESITVAMESNVVLVATS